MALFLLPFLVMDAALPCRARGFTLIEMLTTMVVVAVLAGMSVAALNRMKSRGSFASASGDLLATLRTARAEAFARGNPTVVIVDSQTGQWWSVEDVNGDFSLATFQPWSGIPTGYVNVVLPDGGSGGVADISADGGSSAPNFKYCSFCDSSSKRGAITFFPSGGATFSGGPLTVGQQISLQDVSISDGGVSAVPTGIIDFAVVAATGSTEAVTIR